MIANESYREFADSLQKEYTAAGVSIGIVRPGEFAKIPTVDPFGEEKLLGFAGSKSIWEEMLNRGFLDKEGRVTANFRPEIKGFTLGPVPEFFWPEDEIIRIMGNSKVERFIKQQRKRQARTLNKQLYISPEFEDFWRTITHRTTYRVAIKRDEVIENAVNKIKFEQPIQPLRIQVTKAGTEWFATTLNAIDALANAMKLEIERYEPNDENL